MAFKLLGVGVAPRHHRGVLSNPQIGLPQLNTLLFGQARQPFDGRMQQLDVGREGDGLGLHGGVHRHALEIARTQRAGRVRQPIKHWAYSGTTLLPGEHRNAFEKIAARSDR